MSKHQLNRLSAIQIKTKPVGMHCDGGGLYLQVKHIQCSVCWPARHSQ